MGFCWFSAERLSKTNEQTLATTARPITEDLPKSHDGISARKQDLHTQKHVEMLFSQTFSCQPDHPYTVLSGKHVMFYKLNRSNHYVW